MDFNNADVEDTIKMFGPLNFEDSYLQKQLNLETPCLLCDDTFNLSVCFNIFLKHCFEVHYLVIEDVQNISNLHEYVQYWKKRFLTTPIENVIPSVAIDSTENKFFFISTLIKEDMDLRHKLKLDVVLNRQEFERTDVNYKRICLFCRFEFEGVRGDYIKHLSNDHNLQVGNPQNLVFIDELIEQIESKLNSLQCIYCEKTFPERKVLKEHMRKKIHKRINPFNKCYDQFYVVNYLEPENSTQLQHEEEEIVYIRDNNSDEEYSDWNEKEDQINCLFCPHQENFINVYAHMVNIHKFDFKIAAENLDFYQMIKLVNYIRRQVHNFRCVFCDYIAQDYDGLNNHMVAEDHYKIPSVTLFDQPEYYFPTYENDAFLYYLDDTED